MNKIMHLRSAIIDTLFFGVLWGLSEVLLGTLLHIPFLDVFVGWIMYPIGFWCMFRVYKRTDDSGRRLVGATCVLCCGMIASALKLSTLMFYPAPMSIYAFKPALFILLEAAATAAALVAVSHLMNATTAITRAEH